MSSPPSTVSTVAPARPSKRTCRQLDIPSVPDTQLDQVPLQVYESTDHVTAAVLSRGDGIFLGEVIDSFADLFQLDVTLPFVYDHVSTHVSQPCVKAVATRKEKDLYVVSEVTNPLPLAVAGDQGKEDQGKDMVCMVRQLFNQWCQSDEGTGQPLLTVPTISRAASSAYLIGYGFGDMLDSEGKFDFGMDVQTPDGTTFDGAPVCVDL